MVYADHLKQVGNSFMRSSLGYDVEGGGARDEVEEGGAGDEKGGDYIAVHLRRQDYTISRPGM